MLRRNSLTNLTPYNEQLKICLKTALHSGPMYDALYDPNVSSDAVIEAFELEVKHMLPDLFPDEDPSGGDTSGGILLG